MNGERGHGFYETNTPGRFGLACFMEKRSANVKFTDIGYQCGRPHKRQGEVTLVG